ncbi:MAG: SAM-dependent methyltransferase [Verrucomicrobia bacterium]|nr:SAM-dependent methyltransferase [Verrucomicrobiota bacterium]
MSTPPWISSHLDADGRLRFDRFMELALYDPQHGYYTTHITNVGRSADFSTTATLSNTLGQALAHWIQSHRLRHVIEIGAGNGTLAHSIRRALPFLTRLRLHFHIVERSPVLRKLQQELLGSRVTWHDTPASALDAAHGEALLYSNEVPDAFPARIFRATKFHDAYEELFLLPQGGSLAETWLPAPLLPDSTLFAHAWQEGQRLEVLDSYHTWLTDWIPHWKSGTMLTIDYGDTPAEIYHRRPGGSLRGYLLHQLVTSPDTYANPGRQDLTTDVNFDDLESWGSQLGLRTLSRQTQSQFLAPHARPTHTDTFLTDPKGVGGAFKVLQQKPL